MTSPPPIFIIPKDGLAYHTEIIERCTELINHGIWAGLHISRLRSWLTNFRTDEEKYFSACILDNLIYRSNQQTMALIEQLFQRVIPDLTRVDPPPGGELKDCLYELRDRYRDPRARLVTAVKQTDPPTKSAHEIARFMKRHLGISESWIIKPGDIKSNMTAGIRVFIFIDDFLGTGEQFKEMLAEEGIDRAILKDTYSVYTPLVAHKSGIDELRIELPELRVRSVESLDETYGVFHSLCGCFADGENTRESAKQFYYNLLKKYRIDIARPDRRGFGHLELTYAFEHASPDNSLPILWWPFSAAWIPLFDR